MEQFAGEPRGKRFREGVVGTFGSLFLALILVGLTSSFGALFRPGPWYQALDKPAFTPPGWVFSPVWGALYLMIAAAGWLVWRSVRRPAHPALLAWAGQLVANALWSWIFFGLKNPGLALLDILVLLGLILAFTAYAYPVSRGASLLFVLYALWVGFAAYLNLGIVLLN